MESKNFLAIQSVSAAIPSGPTPSAILLDPYAAATFGGRINPTIYVQGLGRRRTAGPNRVNGRRLVRGVSSAFARQLLGTKAGLVSPTVPMGSGARASRLVSCSPRSRQAKDRELIGWSTEILKRAEFRAGQRLDEMRRNGERSGRSRPQPYHGDSVNLRDLGVSRVQCRRWQKFSRVGGKALEETMAHVKNLEIASIDSAAASRSSRTMRRRSRRSRRQLSYRDNGGATDQRTQLSTARWPCVPNSRWQRSLMRCMGSSRSQAVKRTSDNTISNNLIRLGEGQSGVTCQVRNSPNFTSTSSKIFDMLLACATLEEIAAAAIKRAFDARYASGETVS